MPPPVGTTLAFADFASMADRKKGTQSSRELTRRRRQKFSLEKGRQSPKILATRLQDGEGGCRYISRTTVDGGG